MFHVYNGYIVNSTEIWRNFFSSIQKPLSNQMTKKSFAFSMNKWGRHTPSMFSKFWHMFFIFHLTPWYKWKYRSYVNNLHLSVATISGPKTQSLAKISESILWEPITYTEFTTKATVYFIVTFKLCATHPFYQ